MQIHLQLAGEEHLPNFLSMCEEEDEAVEEAEPGMLYHSLDSHPDSSLKFTWTMILQVSLELSGTLCPLSFAFDAGRSGSAGSHGKP